MVGIKLESRYHYGEVGDGEEGNKDCEVWVRWVRWDEGRFPTKGSRLNEWSGAKLVLPTCWDCDQRLGRLLACLNKDGFD